MRRGFPEYTRRGRIFRKIAIKAGLLRDSSWSRTYYDYVRNVEPGLFSPLCQTTGSSPLISVIVPFFNTPDRYLQPLLDSISNQSFTEWELIMADASTVGEASQRIEDYARRDPRFIYVRLSGNHGIAQNTNEALPHARGRYVAFADHDDVLSPHGLNEVACALEQDPGIGVLYSDEDVLSEDGLLRKGPFFKPGWSPHMFLEMNYTNHLSVIRRDLIDEVGGLRSDLDGAQDYDLLLRIHALDRSVTVGHIPKVLYHWREAEHSTARDISTKRYAIDAGRAALDDYLAAIGVDGEETSDVDGRPGWYRIRPRQSCTALVLVAVSPDPRVNDSFAAKLQSMTRGKWAVPTFETVSPHADMRQYALSHGQDIVVLVRSACLPDEEAWLDDVAGVLALPHTAAVAPLVVDEQRNVVNAGLVRDGGRLAPLYPGCPVTGGGLAGPADLVRDADGLTNHVLAFSRTTPYDGLWSSSDVAATENGDYVVLWGHTVFVTCSAPHPDGILNPRLDIAGSGVAFRGPEDLTWTR